MKTNNTIEKTDRRVGQTLRALVPRIKGNLKRMEKIAEQVTYDLRRKIGADLRAAKKIVDSGKATEHTWAEWLEKNFTMSYQSANRYISLAGVPRSSGYTSITEHLRDKNPNYALPRQSVNDFENEAATKKILSGISTGIFVERTLTVSKEKGLKKKMAIELVDAGFRALSIKAHSDTGGSDEVMRRLTEVRTALKDAIEDDDIYF